MTCRVDRKNSNPEEEEREGGGSWSFDTGDTVWVCDALGKLTPFGYSYITATTGESRERRWVVRAGLVTRRTVGDDQRTIKERSQYSKDGVFHTIIIPIY